MWCFHAQSRDCKITISFNIIISLFQYYCLDFAFESVTPQKEATGYVILFGRCLLGFVGFFAVLFVVLFCFFLFGIG